MRIELIPQWFGNKNAYHHATGSDFSLYSSMTKDKYDRIQYIVIKFVLLSTFQGIAEHL